MRHCTQVSREFAISIHCWDRWGQFSACVVVLSGNSAPEDNRQSVKKKKVKAK